MSYICKIATQKEMIEKWDYEIEIHEEKDNWLYWKNESIKNKEENKQLPYYGILDGNIICEATASISKSIVQNSQGLVSKNTAYLTGFRTKKEYQGQGYFSKLFWYMINDLRNKGYQYVTLGVEPSKTKNMQIYFHYGFNEYIKSGMEFYPNQEEIFVLYYRMKISKEENSN